MNGLAMRWTSIVLAVILMFPLSPLLHGQTPAASFKPEEIEQLVAPIALYPDSLVSQILMASTYPLEVVEADRWAKQNKNQKSDAFAAALEKQSWDPSVKSLVNFPQVLSMMSEKLEVTQKLGDVFLAQQKDVLDAVQRLRVKAQKEGNLKTTKEQKVIVEQPTPTQQTTIIKIEPADPQVVYVPTYNPTVVYGAWPYPAYPPYPYYPPGYVAATSMFSFAAGVAVGAAWGYAWGGCNWHGGDVDIDVNRNTNINNTHINREQYKQNFQARGQREGGSFQHDPSHRKGVGYRDQATSQKFNRGGDAQAAKSREQFRGRAESGRQELAREGGGPGAKGGLGDRGGLEGKGGIGDRSGIGEKGNVGDRGGLGEKGGLGDRDAGNIGDRGGLGDKGGLGDRGGLSNREGSRGDRAGGSRAGAGGRESGAFSGLGHGGDVHNASARGAASRGGGGFHGGGGARGGGGHGGGRRR
jgi:Protein of unknown function (DUF3300)